MNAPRRTRIKFCGMTSAAEIALAVDAGADAVGIIVAQSERRVPLERIAGLAATIPPFVARVGVVADPAQEEAAALRASGFTLQFSGDESPERCEALAQGAPYLKVFHLDPAAPVVDIAHYERYRDALWMFDTRQAGRRGGTGRVFDWTVLTAVAAARPIVLSGGLTAENVGERVAALAPFGVDVRSGIETAAEKDAEKMRAFARAVADTRTDR